MENKAKAILVVIVVTIVIGKMIYLHNYPPLVRAKLPNGDTVVLDCSDDPCSKGKCFSVVYNKNFCTWVVVKKEGNDVLHEVPAVFIERIPFSLPYFP